MISVTASAPGKVVLSGEYAVLRNAPAISLAVDRRAVVQLVETEREFHSVTTPGLSPGEWRFTAHSSGEIQWLDELPAGGLKLIESAWMATRPGERGGMSITVDTAIFFAAARNVKLGLGSSAAAITALIGALDRLDPGQNDPATLASNAHRALQGGLGSGVDVATSLHGGVIEFTMGGQNIPILRRWPDGLGCRFLWSGKAADTMARISKFDASVREEGSFGPLLDAAEEAASAWARGNAAEVLDVFRGYTDTLRRFSVDHDLGIFDAGHDKLTDLAATFEVNYKPCGAGGGDIGVVLGSDESAIRQFCNQAERCGFKQLDIALDPDGMKTSVEGEV